MNTNTITNALSYDEQLRRVLTPDEYDAFRAALTEMRSIGRAVEKFPHLADYIIYRVAGEFCPVLCDVPLDAYCAIRQFMIGAFSVEGQAPVVCESRRAVHLAKSEHMLPIVAADRT